MFKVLILNIRDNFFVFLWEMGFEKKGQTGECPFFDLQITRRVWLSVGLKWKDLSGPFFRDPLRK